MYSWEKARKATDNLGDASLATRPTGAAREMLLNGPDGNYITFFYYYKKNSFWYLLLNFQNGIKGLEVYNCVEANGRRTFAADLVMGNYHLKTFSKN